MRFLMVTLLIALSLSLAACGKKPKTLEDIPNTEYPRVYPAPETLK